MPFQPSLPGIDTPRPTDNLFFAIFPEAGAAECITRLAQDLSGKHGMKGEVFAAEHFHISLHHLGNFVGLPQDILAMAGKAAAAAAAVRPSFEVVFDRAMSFAGSPGNHPFVLCGTDGVAELTAFRQALGAAMARAGFKFRKSHYTPHLTLLYGDRCIAEHVIKSVGWTVREFVLVCSLLGLGQYVSLARWSLLS